MLTTVEFLEMLQAKLGHCSSYRLSVVLETSHQALANYQKGIRPMDDRIALKVASLLDLSPAYVLACAHAEREKDSAVIAAWAALANQFAPTCWPDLMIQEKLAV